MKRKGTLFLLAIAALTVSALQVRPAAADDESHDVEIKILAPLDATACDAVPPTITVLGLTIDVGTASIEAQGSKPPDPTETPGTDDSSTQRHGQGGVNDAQPGGCYYCSPSPTATPAVLAVAPSSGACGALVVGQVVEVELASDGVPLSATDVKQESGSDAETELKGPLQFIDLNGQTITVLGLTVDVSGAGLDGSDDSDQSSQPIDLSQLSLGQFVDVKLVSNVPPLTASAIEVKNFANQVEVEIQDSHGNDVEDQDDNGDPVDDVTVDISETVRVTAPTAGASTTPQTQRVRKLVHLHATSNGSLVLSGLPTGHANIFVTRVNNGLTSVGRRSILVRGNTTRSIHLRLRTRRGR